MPMVSFGLVTSAAKKAVLWQLIPAQNFCFTGASSIGRCVSVVWFTCSASRRLTIISIRGLKRANGQQQLQSKVSLLILVQRLRRGIPKFPNRVSIQCFARNLGLAFVSNL